MGGIVQIIPAAERTLKYGKTEKYVEELEVVLSDGSLATFKSLTSSEVEERKEINRRWREKFTVKWTRSSPRTPRLLSNIVQSFKNSAGCAVWSIRDAKTNAFNLAKLICARRERSRSGRKRNSRSLKPREHRAMLVIFLSDLTILPEIVNRVPLPQNPESFESYDDHTFTLAVKFIPRDALPNGVHQGRTARH